MKEYFEQLQSVGLSFTPEQQERISKKLEDALNYTASIGFFGKTGAGKSSLCNAIFGQEAFPVSDVGACTRNPQEELLSFGSGALKLVDVPGVGENEERDAEYAELYNSLMPHLDLILWVIKGDDRAFISDISFYNKIVKNYIDDKPFFIVLNQVDCINPLREWDLNTHKPSSKQKENIENKVKYVSAQFDVPESHIIPVSANERYNLEELVDEIVFALPKEQVVTLAKYINPTTVSPYAGTLLKDAIEDVGSNILIEEMPEEKSSIALELVKKISSIAIEGASKIGLKSAASLAEEYLKKSDSLDRCIDAMIESQVLLSGTAGFITGVGGLITLPISIPADMLATWVIETRLCAAIAYMYGHDIHEDQVQTFVIATICGDSVKELIKDTAVKAGQNIAKAMIKKMPQHILEGINKKIGLKLLAKSGGKGIVALAKWIPILGGIIGGTIDASYCKVVGKRAKTVFSSVDFE